MPRFLIPFVVLVGLTRPAFGHPLDLGFVRIDASEANVRIELDLESGISAKLVDAPDPAAATARAEQMAALTYRSTTIRSDAGECKWLPGVSATVVDKSMRQTATAACPARPKSLRWEFPWMARMAPTFQLLIKIKGIGDERALIVDRGSHVLDLDTAEGDAPSGFGGFVWSGVEHIGAAPNQWQTEDGGLKLADGIDHILFLLALLIGGGTLLQLIGIATGFTLGHSITLALAGLGIVRIPPTIIEPLVALTIALAALEAFSGRLKEHRWKIASGFGLIHGFAFAFALDELELTAGGKVTALFGFNIGVELGQVIIVLLAAPLVMLIHRSEPKIRDLIVRIAASIIFVPGMYWFFVRVFA